MTEDTFVAALHANRDDDETRAVYADWLEERGDLSRAELLRMYTKRKLSKAERKRRDELVVTTSSEWRRAVSRPLAKGDGETLPLAVALQRITRADHPAAKPIRARVKEWVESFGPDEDDEDDPYGQVILYDGDLAIPKGDLETSASAVVVLGDLAIENQFTDLIESDQSLIAVAGHTSCRSIWQLGDGLFAGNIRCNVLYGSSYSTNRTEILGNVIASEAIIENGHHIVIHGSLHTLARIGSAIAVGGTYFQDGGTSDALDPELLDDNRWNEGRLYKRICDARPILRPALRGKPLEPCVPPKPKAKPKPKPKR